ncbi:unnamed protein product [Brassica rapa subsp. trilocularis]
MEVVDNSGGGRGRDRCFGGDVRSGGRGRDGCGRGFRLSFTT